MGRLSPRQQGLEIAGAPDAPWGHRCAHTWLLTPTGLPSPHVADGAAETLGTNAARMVLELWVGGRREHASCWRPCSGQAGGRVSPQPSVQHTVGVPTMSANRGMIPRCLCSYQMKACVRGSSEGPCAPAFPRAYVGFCCCTSFSPAAPQKCLLLHVPHSQEDPLFSRQPLPSGLNPSRCGPDRRPALRECAFPSVSPAESVLPWGRKAERAEHFHTREAGRRKRGCACPFPPRLGGDLLTTGQVLQGLSLMGG